METSGLNKYADVYIIITMPSGWIADSRNIHFWRNGTHEPCNFQDKVYEYLHYKFPWVNIVGTRDISSEPNLYEGITLYHMWQFAQQNPDRPLGYVHAKGIFSVSPQVKLWREILNDIHINQWRQRVADLDGYDVVAMADATIDLEAPAHVSGNFFWTTTNYVALLPEPTYIDPNREEMIRYEYEKWILINNPRIKFVYNSHVDHFKDYPINP